MINKQFIQLFPLETERLIIRPTIIEDATLLIKLDRNENVQKYLGGIKDTNIESRKIFLQKKINKFKVGIASSLTVELKTNNVPIGFVELNMTEDDSGAKLSYIFDFDYWRIGFCFESCKKLIDVSFEKLNINKIYADTIKGNEPSQKVLEKLGMKLEKTVHKETKDGQIVFLVFCIKK